MKRILLGVAIAAMSMSVAVASADPMASRYGNTVVIKGPDGKEIGRVYYDADKKAVRKFADGTVAEGTWSMEGANLCFNQTKPVPTPPTPAKQCAPFPGEKKVGDTWEVNLPGGVKATATLQAGRP